MMGATMSRWSEQLEKHQIHQTLRQLREWLGPDSEEIDSEHDAERRRLAKGIGRIEEVLARADPELTSLQTVAELDQQLRQTQLWNNLSSYSSGRRIEHIRDANDHLTIQLPILSRLLFSGGSSDVSSRMRDVEAAYERFYKTVEKKMKEYSSRIEAGEAKTAEIDQLVTEIRTQLKDLAERTGKALSEWQGEFTAAQTTRAEEFSSAQIDKATKFDAAVREWRDKSEIEIRSISTEHGTKLTEAQAEFDREAAAILVNARQKHSDILEVHGLVGTDGVAGGYQKNAQDEKDAAIVWRRVAMGSFILAGGWILLKYFLGFDVRADGSVNWPELVAATSLTLVLLGMGGYAARQSVHHREAEQQLRWFALEVKAIDPFLSSLPVENRNQLKDQLTQKLFGQNRTTSSVKDASIDPGAIKVIAEAFQAVLKAAGRG